MHNKLVSFIDAVPSLASSAKIKDDLAQEILPWLKQRYVQKSKAQTNPAVVAAFGRTIAALVTDLPAASMFPLFDFWRLAILEPAIAQVTLTPLVKVLASNSESVSSSPRATLLTLLRLVTNALGTSLSRSLLPPKAQEARAALTSVLVQTLLHQDRLVRVAAASLAFNVGAWVQKGRVAGIKGEGVINGIRDGEEDGEWEVELVSAVAEAFVGEEESEDAGELSNFWHLPARIDSRSLDENKSLTETLALSSAPIDGDAGIFNPAIAFL